MHVGEIGNEEVLVTNDDSGHVAVHFPKNNFERTPIFLSVPMSAWGIDTHSEKRLLAISSNAHIVTIFHLGMGIPGWDWTTIEDDDVPSIILRGHSNNIPCVAFDKSGEFIVSGSLDRNVHLWSCKHGGCVRHIRSPGRLISPHG